MRAMINTTPEPLSGFPVIIKLPILWGDQDAFGHVNNTTAIRWFESARIAYLEQSGMSGLMQSKQLGPILASITCHYRQQLHYPDTVHVGTRIARLGRSSLVMEHAIYSERLEAIAAEGEGTVVLFDYHTQRPQRLPEDIRAAIERVEGKSFVVAK